MAASTAPKKRTAKKAAPKKTLPPPTAAATPSSAADFRKKLSSHMLLLPVSGHTVEVRRPGIQQFMSAGIIPDSLRPLVEEQIKEASNLSPSAKLAREKKLEKAMKEALSSPEAMAEMLRSMKRVAAYSWLAPQLVFHERRNEEGEWETIPESERDLSYLYTDEVEDGDVEFTFTFVCGGTADLEKFRQQAGATLATLRGSEDLAL